jgi:hypothetical protein
MNYKFLVIFLYFELVEIKYKNLATFLFLFFFNFWAIKILQKSLPSTRLKLVEVDVVLGIIKI